MIRVWRDEQRTESTVFASANRFQVMNNNDLIIINEDEPITGFKANEWKIVVRYEIVQTTVNSSPSGSSESS